MFLGIILVLTRGRNILPSLLSSGTQINIEYWIAQATESEKPHATTALIYKWHPEKHSEKTIVNKNNIPPNTLFRKKTPLCNIR